MQKTIVGVLAIIIIVGGWYLWSAGKAQAPAIAPVEQSQTVPAQTDTTVASTPAAAQPAAAGVTVAYDGSSFSPASVTIKKGDSVAFNSTTGDMWVASAPHPAHTGYDGTSKNEHCAAGFAGAAPFDQCKEGASFTFTFNKAGSWGYHNHSNPGAFGTVVVK